MDFFVGFSLNWLLFLLVIIKKNLKGHILAINSTIAVKTGGWSVCFLLIFFFVVFLLRCENPKH